MPHFAVIRRYLRRLLRGPRTIVAEVVAFTAACVVMTIVPQADDATALQLHRFEADWPRSAQFVRLLQLDQVATSAWFLVLVGLILASLGLVLVEQIRILVRTWQRPVTEAALASAPFRVEFERPARGGPAIQLGQSGRVGYAGAAMLHLGLVLCVVAGFGRMLLECNGVIDLVEGETLAAGDTTAWARQWRGALAEPMQVGKSVRFDKLVTTRYPSGKLKEMSAHIRLGAGPASEDHEIAVNTPLDIDNERMYLTADGGPAVLLDAGRGDQVPVAVLLRDVAGDALEYSGTVRGIEVHLRADRSRSGALPNQVFARVLIDSGLRYAGPLAPGQGVNLGQGQHLAIAEIRHWSQFRARRDATLWLAWLGLASGLLGALLIYGVTPVAWMVRVDPLGDREHVVIRMRPLRFVPLFRERFDELVRTEGGNEVRS